MMPSIEHITFDFVWLDRNTSMNHADLFQPRFVIYITNRACYVLNVTDKEAAVVNKEIKHPWCMHGHLEYTFDRQCHTVKIEGGGAFRQEDVDEARSIPSLARYLNL
jgi:hypothetical protein